MASVPFEKKPKPGDLIEIFFGPYQHWAVYIGDGYVVHLVPITDKDLQDSVNSMKCASNGSALAVVKKERLQDVVGTNQWRGNNSLEGEHHPRPSADIVKDAKSLVGTKVRYSVFTSNCEHFATNLRYGRSYSRQVPDVQNVAITTGLAVVVLAATAFLLASKCHRHGDSDRSGFK